MLNKHKTYVIKPCNHEISVEVSFSILLLVWSFRSFVLLEFQLWTHPTLPCNLCLIPKTRSMTTICLATRRTHTSNKGFLKLQSYFFIGLMFTWGPVIAMQLDFKMQWKLTISLSLKIILHTPKYCKIWKNVLTYLLIFVLWGCNMVQCRIGAIS